MNRTRGTAAGIVVATVAAGGLFAAPAQASSTPKIGALGFVTAGSVAVTQDQAKQDLRSLCPLGQSCLMGLWIYPAAIKDESSHRPAFAFVGAGRSASKRDATSRMRAAMESDSASSAAAGFGLLKWKKVKSPKSGAAKKALKGVTAWSGVISPYGNSIRFTVVMKGKRVAYCAGPTASGGTAVKSAATLAKVVRSKAQLPLLVGTARGAASMNGLSLG